MTVSLQAGFAVPCMFSVCLCGDVFNYCMQLLTKRCWCNGLIRSKGWDETPCYTDCRLESTFNVQMRQVVHTTNPFYDHVGRITIQWIRIVEGGVHALETSDYEGYMLLPQKL